MLLVTILSILTVTSVFTHVQYGEAAPGDLLHTSPNPTPQKEGEGKSKTGSTPQATGRVSSVQRMHKDAKVVIITGRAIGRDGEPSDLSVTINGIDFSMTIHPSLSSYAFGDGAGESALQTCDVLSEQIATYTQGARGIPEFDTQCVSLAGEAAILLIQRILIGTISLQNRTQKKRSGSKKSAVFYR